MGFLFVYVAVQVVHDGFAEWNSVWAICSSPEWIAHQIISEVMKREKKKTVHENIAPEK